MVMTRQVEIPTLFEPHPNFSDVINRNIIQSEIEGGVHLRDLLPGTVLEVHTQNHVYKIVSQQDGEVWISGHPVYCPDPVLVDIHGSTWGGSMIRERFIGQGCTSNLVILIFGESRPHGSWRCRRRTNARTLRVIRASAAFTRRSRRV